jgi:predicted ribosome quality control (RQC) complex YloA/Tae2 family protein
MRYDSLLIRHLAAELHTTLAQQRLQALHFARASKTVSLSLEQGILRWSLPTGLVLAAAHEHAEGEPLVLPRKARLESVQALADERVLRFQIGGAARDNAVIELMVELLPPQANAIALDGAGRVLKMLGAGAARPQTRGQPYSPPASQQREGVQEPLSLAEWLTLLQAAPPDERRRLLISRVAYLSPINAAALLGGDHTDAGLQAAHARYVDLVSGPPRPCIVRIERAPQPYGHALWQPAEPCPSLLAAFALANTNSSAPTSDVIRRLEEDITRAQRKQERLQMEQRTAGETATRMRQDADLLLAHAHTVARGVAHVELEDFQGRHRLLTLDPARNGFDNAQAWYAEARKRERAAERLPGLINATERRLQELQAQLGRARSGQPIELPDRPVAAKRNTSEKALPYRRYRTTSGLEVRVGRNSRANDDLTFHHASPDDVWMHAREVGGAHVVLRWTDPKANPARRDLEQAAALAALHSKARHSGIVPVDWTRRKYVRKPRHAAVGSVRVERVKTIFVTPDERLLDALRWPE